MNYQNPYFKNRSDNTYLKKLSFQLLIVLIIMLVFLIIKFVNNDITLKIGSAAREIFYRDYTDETIEVFNTFIPNTKGVFYKLVNKNQEFIIDVMPVNGKIIAQFGENVNQVTQNKEFNYGIKIETLEGTEVKAVYDGRVERVENDETIGISIIINHGNGFASRYGYLSDIKISEGEKVTKGSVIGISGKGKTSVPCVYFELLKNGQPVNPQDYMKK